MMINLKEMYDCEQFDTFNDVLNEIKNWYARRDITLKAFTVDALAKYRLTITYYPILTEEIKE